MDDRWRNYTRIDGLKVLKTGNRAWLIMPFDEGLPVAECPCCKVVFAAAKDAENCAEALFPILGEKVPAA